LGHQASRKTGAVSSRQTSKKGDDVYHRPRTWVPCISGKKKETDMTSRSAADTYRLVVIGVAVAVNTVIWDSLSEITNISNALFHAILFGIFFSVIRAVTNQLVTYAAHMSDKQWGQHGPLITVILQTLEVLSQVSELIIGTVAIKLAVTLNGNSASTWSWAVYITYAVILSMTLCVYTNTIPVIKPT
tara:strand:- start:6279 stop:6842 length:564 start_codon:yes stop_codon:yes gene_type:complete